ncbi:hypothetical protein Nepgr_017012 [Nepenthes gracilis]|uniref:J domain-containing protein n=1 Tax=Nepenthes gracilis TaxID=150966 RepID=A0AAD3SRR5_NEPGR|nr:hypothetical protein Nepgr_017012 [Nepenthes gracilis]
MEFYRRRSESYYSILGVAVDSSLDEIRRAYRMLAMQWHPDRWARNPSLLGEAKSKFQKIQEAYSVLSDPRKRAIYNAGLYDPNDEDDEGFYDFMQEMLALMAQAREEEKACSFEDLQKTFRELASSFNSSPSISGPQPANNLGCSSRLHWGADRFSPRSNIPMSGLEMFGMSSYCGF